MSGDAKTLKKLPHLLTDEEAERFTDEADLSEYDLSGFKPMRFELKKKDRTVSLRLSDDLLQAIKDTAAAEGIPYQRFMRDAIERAVRGVQRRKELEKA